jgi:hypothetical protein
VQAPQPFRAPPVPFSPQPICSSEQVCKKMLAVPWAARLGRFNPVSLFSINSLIVFADSSSPDINGDGLLHKIDYILRSLACSTVYFL